MTAPNIESSTREDRLDYILKEWKCLHNCEPMEQREQKPNLFGLCRVATEEDDSQSRGLDEKTALFRGQQRQHAAWRPSDRTHDDHIHLPHGSCIAD